jgi:peptidyl-prolyl cis-trans isomerase D
MLIDRIRKASQNWLGRAVLIVMFGFLIVSFAIWGIGDIFRGGSATAVARVGEMEVSQERFRQAFQDRVMQLQQRIRGFTNDQARALGLDRQVLDELIAEAAFDQETRRLGLGISEEELARVLVANPAFRGVTGRFDRSLFDNYLRTINMTEAMFLRQLRQATLRTHLTDSLMGGTPGALPVLEAIVGYRQEMRTIAYVNVAAPSVATVPAPDEAALRALYEDRKGALRAPEYRKIVLLTLSPQEFAGDIQVSDADLAAAYARAVDAGRFGTPERRHVQQIVFPTREAAAAAAARLKDGLAFEALAGELRLSAADFDLGLKTRSELVDPAVAAAAFALVDGAVSDPVQGQFGFVLVRVTAIQPAATQPLDVVREALRRELVAARLSSDRTIRDRVNALHDRIEELRSAGKTLAQVSTEIGRPLRAIDALDAQGRDAAGQPVEAVPDAADVIRAVFASDIGVDNEAVRTREGGYVWFEISAIEPARERPFDAVRSDLEAIWRANEVSRIATARASELLAKLNAGAALQAVADEISAPVETAERITRDSREPLSPSAVASAFTLKLNGTAVAPAATGSDRVVLQVTAIETPPFAPGDAAVQPIRSELNRQVEADLEQQYLTALLARLGVSINQRALQQAAGSGAP